MALLASDVLVEGGSKRERPNSHTGQVGDGGLPVKKGGGAEGLGQDGRERGGQRRRWVLG